MSRIRLLHWNREEAARYLDRLRASGHTVEYEEKFRPELMKLWRESPPDAFVIDLSRLPSHGREIGVALRNSRRTASVPLIFCEGPEEKVAAVRNALPDAACCTLRNLRSTLQNALHNPPRDPVKPVAMMDRYSSRTVAQKLGIRESSTLRVLDPPRDFTEILRPLPEKVEFLEDGSAQTASVTLCFVHDAPSLSETLSRVRTFARNGKLWILWRKGGQTARGDLTETLLRINALDLGLVDYKICSVNQLWSAMLFSLKR